VLFPGQPADGSLSKWRWDLPPASARYQALFPRAWTTYDDPLPGIRLTCRQLSPVIAHNYQESSYPVSEFRWRIENHGPLRARIGLMFTFQNGMGAPGDRAGGHANTPFEQDGCTGILLRHNYQQQQTLDPTRKDRKRAQRAVYHDPLSFAIAARCEPGCGGQVSYRARFNPQGDGADLWADLVSDGRLDNLADPRPSATGETIGAALAATVEVLPGEAREVAFSLAWDMPLARMGGGAAYQRRYTCFFPVNGAVQLAADALRHADDWENQIEAWQSPILEDAALPAWYRGALFNELYYLVDGGTVWGQESGQPAPDAEMGHFGYLEGHEYRFLNTYDVHFYASFALAQNWPKIELALQRDIAAATLAEYPGQFTEMYTGRRVPRKLSGAVPHDAGQTYEDPWRLANAYFLHNVNDWKDLNAKFVLQVYRDYLVTGDLQFVHDTWEAVDAAIRRLHRFDRDGDGLIENDGYPDQTYDLWPVKGPSAYTGGLWLACLTAGAALADLNSEGELAYEYRKIFARGKKAYAAYLWNGSYFNYDSSTSPQHDSIMADQLAGQWYAQACGLPSIALPEDIQSALETVYEMNVRRFQGGQMGAVNGMRPDGQVDRSCMQSQEVWTGTSYAAAAAMIQEGLVEAGFATARGVARTTYHDSGYWFQTPEAWDAEGNYRSIAYMRPLAIWAMQWALRMGKREESRGELV
jgi:non-lysosomal glucosylceramidase